MSQSHSNDKDRYRLYSETITISATLHCSVFLLLKINALFEYYGLSDHHRLEVVYKVFDRPSWIILFFKVILHDIRYFQGAQ